MRAFEFGNFRRTSGKIGIIITPCSSIAFSTIFGSVLFSFSFFLFLSFFLTKPWNLAVKSPLPPFFPLPVIQMKGGEHFASKNLERANRSIYRSLSPYFVLRCAPSPSLASSSPPFRFFPTRGRIIK